MSLLRSLSEGLRSLFRKERVEGELDEELNGFLEMAAEEKMKQGMSRKDALRAVRLERGSLEVTKEVVRSAGWESFVETLWQDLRFALRSLRKNPGFTAVAVLTLALGIGANTAIFSAVNGVLLKPLPYPGSDRLVQVMSTGFRGMRFGVSFPDLHDLRALSQDFTGVAAARTQRHNLTGAGDPRDVQTAAVTADLLDVLQLRPEIGHRFAPAEERTPLALLSHGLWVTSFGRDPGILGRSISLDGRSFTVVGVMPAGFQFPNEDVQVWTPIGEFLSQNPQAETNRGMHFLPAVARLAPGVALERAVGDVKGLGARLSA